MLKGGFCLWPGVLSGRLVLMDLLAGILGVFSTWSQSLSLMAGEFSDSLTIGVANVVSDL